MRKMTSGGGWRAILYTLKKSRQMGGIFGLWKAMRSKNACKTCALGMGGQKGGMVNEAGQLPRGLQEVAAGDGRRHAGGDQAGVLEHLLASPQLQAFSPRELETCGRLVAAGRARTPGEQYYRPISWDDALGRIVAKLKATHARRNLLVLQRPQLERGRLSAATLRPALRHEQRQQLQLLLPPGQRRRACQRRSAPARRRSRSRTSSTPTCVFVIGGNPASNHPRLMRTLMNVRRRGGRGDRHQPGRRNGPGQLPRAERPAEPAVRHEDRHALRAAAHRRRPGAADRHRQADRRNGRARRGVPARALRRLGRLARAACERLSLGARSTRSRGVAQSEIDADRRALRRGQERRLRLDDGHHAPRARRRRTCRRSPTWPCCAAWSAGRTPGLLPIRGHSNVQGIGIGRRDAEAEGRRLRAAGTRLRRQAADDAGPRHDGLHGGGRRAAS